MWCDFDYDLGVAQKSHKGRKKTQEGSGFWEKTCQCPIGPLLQLFLLDSAAGTDKKKEKSKAMPDDFNKNIRRKQTAMIVLFILLVAGVLIFITNHTAITGHNPAVSTADKQPDFFEKIGNNFRENPKNFGWFSLGAGVFILAASVFNWNWIFKGNSYNLQKIEGIANVFGRGVARIYWGIGGIICVVLGIIIFLIG